MISIIIGTENAAFDDDAKCDEIARIFEEATNMVTEWPNTQPLHDSLGNNVGALVNQSSSIQSEEVKSGSKIVLTLTTENEAFTGGRFESECIRIIRDAADSIRNGKLNFRLIDNSGNPVGSVEDIERVKEGEMNSDALSKVKTFIKFVEGAGALSIDDGPVQVGGYSIDHIAGEVDNEVVRFTWTDGDDEFATVLTEGGIANGSFDSIGNFVCDDKDGFETVFRFFSLERFGPDDLSKMTETKDKTSGPLNVGDTEPLTGLERLIADSYLDGEMSYVKNMDEVEKCGDTLLLFLLRESRDSSSLSEFEEFMEAAQRQLTDLMKKVYIANDQSLREAEKIAAAKGEYRLVGPTGGNSTKYIGPVLGVTDHHVVQSLGRSAVIHHKDNLEQVVLKGDDVSISYGKHGKAPVISNSMGMANVALSTDEYHDALKPGDRPVFDVSVGGFIIPSQRDLGVFPRSYKDAVQALARSLGTWLSDDELKLTKGVSLSDLKTDRGNAR